MSSLTEELRAEHAEIVDMLLRVKLLNIATPDGQQKLMEFRDRLLAHLKKEDDRLYPSLNLAGADDPGLKSLLDESEQHMSQVSLNVINFYDKYSGYRAEKDLGSKGIRSFLRPGPPVIEQDEFLKDFENIYQGLLVRLDKEERVLFMAFESLREQA
ncbi:MAG: hemerythrin domain-containing protein [Nitrospirae bacterium]|nr:hemerythrin domain-containing protein [Nitrospirota bacterium]